MKLLQGLFTFGSLAILVALAAVPVLGVLRADAARNAASDDRKAILDHVHGIFQAYLNQDRQVIRATHSDDWTGFLGPSTSIERGIDAYMASADQSMKDFRGTGYRIIDTEIQIYGDIGLIYYLAAYDYQDLQSRERGTITLRSLDVYRRRDGDWIQAGSHITTIPENPSWIPKAASLAGSD